MSLIDHTYFAGLINLDTASAVTKEVLSLYVDYTEKRYIKKLLGSDFKNYDVVEKPAKYVDFLEKEYFDYNGESYENDIKQMIAYFTYFEYVQDSQGFNTKMGEKKANTTDASSVSPDKKLIRAYNDGVALYKIAALYLVANDDFDVKSEVLDTINSFGI